MNFNSARKLCKVLFLLFRSNARTKYAFYSFQFLCQVYYLLPERFAFSLVHKRFTNNKGLPDSNVEMDREVEHWNKCFKMDCKEFQGKVTNNSIEKASTSYQHMEEVISSFDNETETHRRSGNHSRKSVVDDVNTLSEQLKGSHVFHPYPGRSHSAFELPCQPVGWNKCCKSKRMDAKKK